MSELIKDIKKFFYDKVKEQIFFQDMDSIEICQMKNF